MIKENVQTLLKELPAGVELVAAVKARTPNQVLEAIQAGIRIIGHNYIQEAESTYPLIGTRVSWHFIGALQKNKVKTAVRIFDMIETVDSFLLAQVIAHQCVVLGKIMPVLLEVNSGRETQKSGILPEEVEALIKEISRLKNIKITGLMTMGPNSGNPEEARSYFMTTRILFDKLKKLNIPGVEMKYLSMGMTNSYKVALEAGANMVRIGSKIFGDR
jgi:pyridoxal phosphate enzyme (YggS family)